MRAFLIAIAFAIAISSTFGHESLAEELLEHSHAEIKDHPLGEQFVEDSAPIKVAYDSSFKKGKVLLESDLAAQGSYWKWADKYKTKADGKYRLRQKLKNGKVVQKDWVRMALPNKGASVRGEAKHEKTPKGMSVRVEAKHEKNDPEFVETGAGRRRLCARLYEHSNFRGRVYNVYSNVRFVGWFNDKLSSMRVYGCTIRLYQHSHYRGRSHAYGPGSYNFNVIRRTIGNDQVSSVRVWHRRQRRRHRHRRRYPSIYRHGLFRMNVFYFRQGSRLPNLHNRRFNMARWKRTINYRNTSRRWPGFARADHFAVRWTGRVRFFRSGWYYYRICSDDGSKLWIDNRYTINNDGLHGWRCRSARKYTRGGWHMVRAEMFEHAGAAGMQLAYRGPDTGNRWRVMRSQGYRHRRRRHRHRRHFHRRRSSSKGCRQVCYRPYRNRKVCAYQCSGRRRHRHRRHRHRRPSWKHAGLQCRTTAAASNHAGVVYARQPGGYTMVGGGINNHYRSFNKLSAFEESFPHGSNWRCDTGFGPGRVTCYARSCRMRGLSCTTRSVYKHGSGIAQASLPGGYVMTSGGIFNHYRHWNKHAAFETSIPIGSRTWRCDMGLGAGRFNCYVRGCRYARGNTRLHCITRHSGVGNHHNVQCPRHWTMTGCGQNEMRRQWNHLSGFEEIRPHGNGCVCDSGFGPGRNRCYARCCRHIVRRL